MAKKQTESAYERLEKNTISTRAMQYGKTFDEKSRSVDAVFATEEPAAVFDWERWDIVNEVLLVSGMSYPEQVPLLDSHDRSTVKAQLGSGVNMRIENNQLIGTLRFSEKPDAEEAMTLCREGHLTDVSIGYRVKESVWVPEGESTVIDGKTFVGPVKVSTKSEIMEISLTPIGADSLAKIRSAFNAESNSIKTLTGEVVELRNKLDLAYQAIRQIVNHKPNKENLK